VQPLYLEFIEKVDFEATNTDRIQLRHRLYTSSPYAT